MIAGLEAAKLPPQTSARIGAIVQASVFDAVNGIERRYTPYHVDPAAPPRCLTRRRGRKRGLHGARRADPVPEAAVRPAARGDTGADLRRPLRPGPIGAARARLGADGCDDILAWRAADGFNAVLPPYVGGTRAGRLAADAAALRAAAVPAVRQHDPVRADLPVAVPARRPAAIDQRPLRTRPERGGGARQRDEHRLARPSRHRRRSSGRWTRPRRCGTGSPTSSPTRTTRR